MNESQNNSCVDTGTLLNLHNGTLSPDEAHRVQAHLASCAECAANDRFVQQTSNEVYDVLATLEPAQDEQPDTARALAAMRTRMYDEGLLVEQPESVALRGVSTSRSSSRGTPRLLRVNRKRQYGWLAVAVAAALLALLLLPNAGVLASQFLSLFQVKQFQPVSVSPQDFNTTFLQDLRNFGHVDQNLNGDSGFVDNQTEAQVKEAIHFPLLLPTHLPSGVSNTPSFTVFQGGSATFTFDAAEARAYLAHKGYKNVTIPANLDGSVYTITMSPGAVITYQATNCQSQSSNQAKDVKSSAQCMALAIAEIPSPVIQSSSKGASLSDLKDFFVSLPDQTDGVRTLLQHVDLSNGVVPLPIPPQIHAQQVTAHGSSGLLLSEQSLKVGAVLWQAQGIIYLVAAQTGDGADLMTTVNSLQ